MTKTTKKDGLPGNLQEIPTNIYLNHRKKICSAIDQLLNSDAFIVEPLS